MTSPSTDRGPRADRTWMVAASASLWGLDGLLRKPLASALQPATVVLWEHLLACLFIAPLIPAAARAFRRCSSRDRAAVIAIGVGSSAVATALFTKAFALAASTGDFITPLVLQKVQPLVAVALAVVVLGERLRPGFAWYAVPALAGSWLLTFAEPFHVQAAEAKLAACALGAACLWGAGTVLGRRVGHSVSFVELTALRYVWGLVGAIAITVQQRAPLTPGVGNLPGLLLLTLIPGLAALFLYYFGLSATAAARATFAELAFPATAAIVGVAFLGTTLVWSQWLGFAVVVAAIVGLGWQERTRRPTVQVEVEGRPRLPVRP